MPNFKKLKNRSKLGSPPSEIDVGDNLSAPETAPQADDSLLHNSAKVDGRTLRASGRTEPFATRVTPGVRKRYKMIAMRDDITMGELLERALVAYEKLQEK